MLNSKKRMKEKGIKTTIVPSKYCLQCLHVTFHCIVYNIQVSYTKNFNKIAAFKAYVQTNMLEKGPPFQSCRMPNHLKLFQSFHFKSRHSTVSSLLTFSTSAFHCSSHAQGHDSGSHFRKTLFSSDVLKTPHRSHHP